MKKNIIICCDGTGNQFGEENSNVVKLYACLDKSLPDQLLYYDAGVGTLTDPGFSSNQIIKELKKLPGKILGKGLYENVSQAYGFLMDRYEMGDDIYLFGFSRGAYTVRVLAGFIQMCGLLPKGNQNQIPYAWDLYNIGENPLGKFTKFKQGARYKMYYSRNVPIRFVGTWDTVSSVGWFWNWKAFPYTFRNNSIQTIRHAIAIDERRAFYRTNMWFQPPVAGKASDVKQVWFAGVHSDVGGSYPEAESALAKISLEWMIRESKACGLRFDPKQINDIVMGNSKRDYIGPDPYAQQHYSLNGGWWILEFLPRMKELRKGKLKINKGRYRFIPSDARIHYTVIDRMKNPNMNYKPSNLNFTITNIET